MYLVRRRGERYKYMYPLASVVHKSQLTTHTSHLPSPVPSTTARELILYRTTHNPQPTTSLASPKHHNMKFSHIAATLAAFLGFASVAKADFYANFFDGESAHYVPLAAPSVLYKYMLQYRTRPHHGCPPYSVSAPLPGPSPSLCASLSSLAN